MDLFCALNIDALNDPRQDPHVGVHGAVHLHAVCPQCNVCGGVALGRFQLQTLDIFKSLFRRCPKSSFQRSRSKQPLTHCIHVAPLFAFRHLLLQQA